MKMVENSGELGVFKRDGIAVNSLGDYVEPAEHGVPPATFNPPMGKEQMMVLRKSLVLAVFAAAIVAMVSASALAQPRGRRGDRGFGGGGGKLMMLQDSAIRAELEIVPEQEKELEKIRDEVRNTFREMFSGMRDLPEDKRREAFGQMREKMQEATKDIEAKVNKVLLPNQQQRLNELATQRSMRRGADSALGSEELAKALGITEEQKKRLAEVAQKVQKELQEKTEKLRQEARDEILQVLTPQQREKLTTMLGKQYTPPPREDRRRGPRRD